jgi:cytochrome b561
MQWRNSTDRYGAVAQLLHWGMFVLIALNFIGGEVMGDLPKKAAIRGFAFDAHETLGVVLLALLALRLWWKVANPAPPATGPAWQRAAANAVHVLLYALLVAIPLAGYVMVCAKGHAPAFFAWDLPILVGKGEALAKAAKEIHETLATALIVVVALHAAAALWHHLVARDAVLRRMLPGRHGNGPFGFRH